MGAERSRASAWRCCVGLIRSSMMVVFKIGGGNCLADCRLPVAGRLLVREVVEKGHFGMTGLWHTRARVDLRLYQLGVQESTASTRDSLMPRFITAGEMPMCRSHLSYGTRLRVCRSSSLLLLARSVNFLLLLFLAKTPGYREVLLIRF